MIITDNQFDAIADLYTSLVDLTQHSVMPFPFGLPGWKMFQDLSTITGKILKLNRLTPVKPIRGAKAEELFYGLLTRVSLEEDDELKMEYIIRSIPVIFEKMEKEHVLETTPFRQ